MLASADASSSVSNEKVQLEISAAAAGEEQWIVGQSRAGYQAGDRTALLDAGPAADHNAVRVEQAPDSLAGLLDQKRDPLH